MWNERYHEMERVKARAGGTLLTNQSVLSTHDYSEVPNV